MANRNRIAVPAKARRKDQDMSGKKLPLGPGTVPEWAKEPGSELTAFQENRLDRNLDNVSFGRATRVRPGEKRSLSFGYVRELNFDRGV